MLILLRARPWLAIAFGTTCSALILIALLIDTQVYLLYRFHINAGVLNLLFGGAAGETFLFPRVMYLQAALLVAGIAGLQVASALLWWRYVRRVPGRPAVRRAAIASLTVAVIAFHSVHIWAGM